MGARSHLLLIAVPVLVWGGAGCAARSDDGRAPTATAGTSGAQVVIGDTINYGSFGTTADVDCGDRKALNIGGSNNTLTVRGTCRSVSIGGADNKVRLAAVDGDVNVVGLNNAVTYAAGDPKVSDLGSGNSVTKG